MEEKEEVVNINFFRKMWYSITKFEQYPAMATEGFGRAIKYLIALTAIVTIFAMIGSLIQLNKLIENLANYIDENIPEFTFSDGKITAEMEEPMLIENVNISIIDRIVLNPLVETDEEKQKVEEEQTAVGITVFIFKDKIMLKSKDDKNQTAKQEYTYSDFIASYIGQDMDSFNKADLVEALRGPKMNSFYFRYCLSLFIYLLFLNIIYALLDAFELGILGWITASLAKIKMRFVAIYNMAVYSLTLPMILNILYMIINYFTNFTIKYFQIAYITIAYVYLAATIFIIKDDFIKRMQEVARIKQEQKKVREEIQEKDEQDKPKDEEDEKKEEKDKKDDNDGKEPQGSEA